MASTVIAGKPSNIVGEKDSTLVLRGSSVKVLWGNKFIDLIKNGKLNVELDKILKAVNSIDDAKKDGIYLVEDSIWIVIGGSKIQLTGTNSTVYVSFAELQKASAEEKGNALKNIGFYYNTLEEALNQGLSSGIIYVLGDNKLYTIIDGQFFEYFVLSPILEEEKVEETLLKMLYIEEYSLFVDGDEYLRCENSQISVLKLLVTEQGIYSLGASSNYGYRLYTKYGKSYLEVDNLIVRNTTPDKVSIYPIKYYLEENMILSVVDTEEINLLQLTLLYSDKYKIGDILTTSVLLDNEVEINDNEIITELVLTSIDFKIESTEDNKTYIVSTEFENLDSNILSSLINKSIFYKKGYLPVARVKDNNYDLFEANSELNIEDIGTRIGNIFPIIIGDLNISDLTDISSGIYSNNAFLVNSKQYNTIFKNLDGTYPQYEKDWIIPDSSNDQTIVTSAWVKKQLENNEGGTSEDYSNVITNLLELINILNETISTLNNTVNILYNGNLQNPVLLMSGILYTTYEDGILWYFSGNKKKEILNINITRIGGKIEVVISGQRTLTEVNLGTEEYPDNRIYVEECSIVITGVSANQYSSPHTIKHSNEDSYKEHGNGAHWFETRHSSNTFSVREFHQENDHNDSWRSGWSNETCRNITVNVFGYMYINKYYE